jgi:anti-sigma-K factor RskA
MEFLKRDEADIEKRKRIERRIKDDPEFKEAYGRAMEQARNLHPLQLAKDRRHVTKQMRFQGKIPKLTGKVVAIRHAMEKHIND